MEFLHKEEGYKIIGACYEVYNELGAGFLESVFQEAMEREFSLQGIPFKSQPELTIYYKGEPLKHTFRPDLVVYDDIVVELKAVKVIEPIHEAQVLNYLKATGYKVGYLVNFGSFPKIEIKRLVL